MSGFQQDSSEKAKFENLYMIKLLFSEEPTKLNMDILKKALIQKFGEVDTVANAGNMHSFAIKKYPVQYTEGLLPAQIVLTDSSDFIQDSIDTLSRSQFWNIANSEEILASCSHEVAIFDMMSSLLEYKDRCEMLMDWLEVALEIYPNCKAVWVKSAGKLLLPEQILNSEILKEDRFLHSGVNIRFFNIQGTEDSVIDTLGLYAIGLPDVQYHFHGVDPNKIVSHAFDVAHYTYVANAPINDGETIGGFEEDSRWKCQYEDSLIQPVRVVLDICAGEYASGTRNNEEEA